MRAGPYSLVTKFSCNDNGARLSAVFASCAEQLRFEACQHHSKRLSVMFTVTAHDSRG